MTIKQIADKINQAISSVRPPQSTLPAILLACSAINRPGLSAMELASSIIAKQRKNGVDSGPMPDGAQNEFETMIKVFSEEIVSAIKLKSQVQTAIPIGSVPVSVVVNTQTGVGTGCNITASNTFGVSK